MSVSVSVSVSVPWNSSLSDVRTYRRVGRVGIVVRVGVCVGVGVVECQLNALTYTRSKVRVRVSHRMDERRGSPRRYDCPHFFRDCTHDVYADAMLDAAAVDHLRRAVQSERTVLPAAAGHARSTAAQHRRGRRTLRRLTQHSVRTLYRNLKAVVSTCVKLAFHDADTDTDTDSDSPDTSVHPYVRYARIPHDDREEVRVGVGVGVRFRLGVVECQLNHADSASFDNIVTLSFNLLNSESMHAERLACTVCLPRLGLIARVVLLLERGHTDRHTDAQIHRCD